MEGTTLMQKQLKPVTAAWKGNTKQLSRFSPSRQESEENWLCRSHKAKSKIRPADAERGEAQTMSSVKEREILKNQGRLFWNPLHKAWERKWHREYNYIQQYKTPVASPDLRAWSWRNLRNQRRLFREWSRCIPGEEKRAAVDSASELRFEVAERKQSCWNHEEQEGMWEQAGIQLKASFTKRTSRYSWTRNSRKRTCCWEACQSVLNHELKFSFIIFEVSLEFKWAEGL